MVFNSPENVRRLTPLNPFERFEDGRPRVPDDLLERMKLVTNDEAWGVLERGHGYFFQFEGNWLNLHPERVLVGRAVTATFAPLRPDLHQVVEDQGRAEGRSGGQNTWVIDTLVKGDVIVVDMFGKIRDGTFAGDNLSTTILARTGTGMVIHGGIRDLTRVLELPDLAIFVRGVDPSAIAQATLIGVNVPIRIGNATVLPGDVVLGTPEGVTFVPPHLVQEVVERSEDVRERDVFGKQRLAEGAYTSGQIDVSVMGRRHRGRFRAMAEGTRMIQLSEVLPPTPSRAVDAGQPDGPGSVCRRPAVRRPAQWRRSTLGLRALAAHQAALRGRRLQAGRARVAAAATTWPSAACPAATPRSTPSAR